MTRYIRNCSNKKSGMTPNMIRNCKQNVITKIHSLGNCDKGFSISPFEVSNLVKSLLAWPPKNMQQDGHEKKNCSKVWFNAPV